MGQEVEVYPVIGGLPVSLVKILHLPCLLAGECSALSGKQEVAVLYLTEDGK